MKEKKEKGKGFPQGKVKRKKVRGYVGIYVQESSHRVFQGKKDECFYFVIRDGKKVIWRKVGWRSEGVNARLAFQKRMEALKARAEGEPILKDITLSELWGRYLEWAKGNKKTWKKDLEHYRNALAQYFGEKTLVKRITVKDVEGFKQFRLSQGDKPATVNRRLACLKTMINKGKLWGLVRGDNPVSLAGMLPENNLDVARFLSREEVRKILKNCNPRSKPIIAFMLSTGLRVGNVLGLTWDMVDMEMGVIHLPKTKSGRPLTVPLNRSARNILEALPRHEESPYVFTKPDGSPMTYKILHDDFQKACKRAGINPPPRLHDLRHSWASWMVAAGVPTPLVQIMGGWSTLAMLSRYSHASPGALAEMASKALPELLED